MTTENKTAVICVTQKGYVLAKIIYDELSCDLFYPSKIGNENTCGTPYEKISDIYAHLFTSYEYIISIMAQGITTRMIAPHIKSKLSDPAVVAVDEVGRFSISALSGHEGGANLLAYTVASITGAEPVITTATEANKFYIAGVGCRKDVSKEDIVSALQQACKDSGIEISDLRMLASAYVKKEEEGLIKAAEDLGLYLRFLPKRLYENELYNFEKSTAAKHFDIPAVAEPSAILSARNPKIILKKTVYGPVTVAIVKENLLGA